MSHTESIRTINRYYELAEKAARKYEQKKRQFNTITIKKEKHTQKYEKVLTQSAKSKIPALLVVPAHLAVSVVEGMIAAPLFAFLFQGILEEDSLLLVFVSYLPILIFFGLTLSIGRCIHAVELQQDDLRPRKYYYNFVAVVGVIALTFLYLFLLNKLMEAGVNLASTQASLVEIIFWVGLSELALGIFAPVGWEIFYVHIRLYYFRSRKVKVKNKMEKSSYLADYYFRFYQQYLKRHNRRFGDDKQLNEEFSVSILKALAHYSRRENSTLMHDNDVVIVN